MLRTLLDNPLYLAGLVVLLLQATGRIDLMAGLNRLLGRSAPSQPEPPAPRLLEVAEPMPEPARLRTVGASFEPYQTAEAASVAAALARALAEDRHRARVHRTARQIAEQADDATVAALLGLAGTPAPIPVPMPPAVPEAAAAPNPPAQA